MGMDLHIEGQHWRQELAPRLMAAIRQSESVECGAVVMAESLPAWQEAASRLGGRVRVLSRVGVGDHPADGLRDLLVISIEEGEA